MMLLVRDGDGLGARRRYLDPFAYWLQFQEWVLELGSLKEWLSNLRTLASNVCDYPLVAVLSRIIQLL